MSASRIPARPRRARRLLAAVAAVAAAVALPLLAPAAASAHWAVVETSPADGSTVDVLPDEVSFTFSGALLDGAPQSIYVTDDTCAGIDGAVDNAIPIDPASCTDYASGDAVVNGYVLTQPLDTAGAPAGEYTMIATVTYSDGHSESLVRRFTASEPADGAGEPSATPSADPTSQPEETTSPSAGTASPEPEPSATGTPADTDSFSRNLPWIIGGGVLAAGGGALVAVLVARSRRR
ncbi:copper resistance protein CopC [Microbacterium gilvum]